MTLPAAIEEDISRRLNQIASHFIGTPKITLLVRNELGSDKDADVVMTNDLLPDAIAALQHRHTKDQEARS